MPTTNKFQYYNKPKPSVQEIKLDAAPFTPLRRTELASLVEKSKTNTKRSIKSRYGACDSIQDTPIISAGDGEFDKQTKPYISVPSIQLRLTEQDNEATPLTKPPPKNRGYDFTSSTNSHFEGWIVGAPQKIKPPRARSSTSTTIKRRSSALSHSQQTTTIPTSPSPAKVSDEQLVTSQEMLDSKHKASDAKPVTFHGPEWKTPCGESVVAGAPKPFVGNCSLTIEQFAKLSRTRQKFFLTQDPREKLCLVNPQALHKKEFSEKGEYEILTKTVKYADNLCGGETQSKSTESFICEQIDLENPLQLDYQGLDYQKIYEGDEQDVQNQSVYRAILRYMERRRVKKEIEESVEQELQAERLAVPQCFNVPYRNYVEKERSPETQQPFCKLYRTADKPYNQEQITEEDRKRRKRYKNLYLERKQLTERGKAVKQQQDQVNEELKPAALAKKHFAEALNAINAKYDPAIKIEHLKRETAKPPKSYPHTMRETKQYQKKLNIENRKQRDKALIKKEYFLEKFGKLKDYPEAKIAKGDISETPRRKHSAERDGVGGSPVSPTLCEQSSDDEDNIEVGKMGSNYKLRGFHFKLGDSLRGKRHQKEQIGGLRKEKSCKTREQWLAELIPKEDTVKLDIEAGITKVREPDDPLLKIFTQQYGYKLSLSKNRSAIREYIKQRLGRHYDRDLRKKLRMVRPRLEYPLKKFNLIRYLYDDNKQALQQQQKQRRSEQQRQEELELRSVDVNYLKKLNTTAEYMDAKEQMRKEALAKKKANRLKLLGIPCHEIKKSSLQTKCEQSDTDIETDDDASDWVPAPEPGLLLTQSAENARAKAAKSVKLPMRQRGNMPAPKYRETTLRRHPRHPRDYSAERVPTQLFDHMVVVEHKPHLLKLHTNDDTIYSNLHEVQKSEYARKFEARHHHDHWNPIQHKSVDVHYQAKIVRPEITQVTKHKADHVVMENFRMAQPPCNKFVEMDLTLPNAIAEDTKAMIENYLQATYAHTGAATAEESLRIKDLCHARDFHFHSRADGDESEIRDYPGRKEYLAFMHEVRKALYETQMQQEEAKDKDKQKLFVNRDEIIAEIEEDLKSIASCLTSLSSSVCTNLTNDSGSFLLLEGKTKVPLDYIRKSFVPFEAINRCRFKFEPLDSAVEQQNPFKVLPFAGQAKEQRELLMARDGFFTFATRLQNGLRLRLEVPVEDVRKKLIGRYHSVVTTDFDEHYVNELRNRPPVKVFRLKSAQAIMKDALRLKFESLVMQGQIIRTKIYDALNENHWQSMLALKSLYEELFAKWKKLEYEAAMSVVHQVKSFYDGTDELQREYRELKRQLTLVNMDIVFIEGQWVQRIMLQNFHYLLGDSDWRYKNDWIHRIAQSTSGIATKREESEVPQSVTKESSDEEVAEEEKEKEVQEEHEGEVERKIKHKRKTCEHESVFELENFEVSIARRSRVNIRRRDKDDAWAIKDYYDNVYLQNIHPVMIVFPDADAFMQGIENLKRKTFVLLLEMHFTLSIHAELQQRLEMFVESCVEELREKEAYVWRKSAKLYFMSDRAADMKELTMQFLTTPIEHAYNDEQFMKQRAVITEVWRTVVPADMRSARAEETIEPLEMVAMISEVVIELIANFESIPMAESQRIETHLRRRRAYDRKISKQAYFVEKRIECEMRKVRKNLEPPYVKPKRLIGSKLPRYMLKKKQPKMSIREQRVSEHTKFFFRAFNDAGDVLQTREARDSIYVMDTIQEQIVPFYFDHFLKLNGYKPNYNFKTNIELRDGPETGRAVVRKVLPEVLERLDKWEAGRRRIMEENIQRNPKMYENVNF